MPSKALPNDTFGDPFDLRQLPLPRSAIGYGIQKLDTDQLLDRVTETFIEVRQVVSPDFPSFETAFYFAAKWLEKTNTPSETHNMAIVPLGYDTAIGRFILIYGVLRTAP